MVLKFLDIVNSILDYIHNDIWIHYRFRIYLCIFSSHILIYNLEDILLHIENCHLHQSNNNLCNQKNNYCFHLLKNNLLYMNYIYYHLSLLMKSKKHKFDNRLYIFLLQNLKSEAKVHYYNIFYIHLYYLNHPPFHNIHLHYCN